MKVKILKRTIFIGFLFLSFFSVSVFGQQDTIKILAIGNSFSVDAVEHYLYNISADEGVTVLIGNANIGGCSLETHWNNANNNSAAYSYTKIEKGVYSYSNSKRLSECILDEDWDYITLQQVSQNSGMLTTFFPYLTNLVKYVKDRATNPDVKLAMHMTWAYASNSTHSGFLNYNSNQTTMYESIVSAVNSAALQAGISIVIPAGTAVQNARSSSLGDNFCRDGYHMNNWGWYTIACAWAEKLFGVNTIGCTFVPSDISAASALIMQTAAHNALLKPTEVTSMGGSVVVESGLPDKSVNIDFGEATSVSPPWNNMTNPKTGAISNLTNAKGVNTGISITLNDPFTSVNQSGAISTTTALLLPESASKDCFYGNATGVWEGQTEVTGGFSVAGLNPNTKYTFSFFPSRAGVADNRETQYTITGLSQQVAFCNASGNTSTVAEIIDVTPSAQGTVTISVTAGTNNSNGYKFYYINAMQILPQESLNVGVKDINDISKDIQVYSNKGKIIISTVLNNLSYAIYNLDGQILLTNGISAGKYEIPMSKGAYIVKINNISKKLTLL